MHRHRRGCPEIPGQLQFVDGATATTGHDGDLSYGLSEVIAWLPPSSHWVGRARSSGPARSVLANALRERVLSFEMVEGPQCHLKARKLEGAGVVGKRVLRAVCPGNATLGARLINAGPVLRIITVGKECFCVFADCALRLHFAMSGSQVIRNGPAAPLPRGSRKVLTLTLEFQSRCAVDVFDASTPTVRTLGYLANVESRAGRDVIADEFQRQSVIDLLRHDPRPALDALMDQQTFPGVGNVIKCEGLHEACVSPTIVLSELPVARLSLLVDVLRAFAQRWLDACRRGVGISKRIYGVTTCRCGQQVGLVRAGEKNRITYFCAKCQSRENSLLPRIPRRSGTLLGWLQGNEIGRSNYRAAIPYIPLEHSDHESEYPVVDSETQIMDLKWVCKQCTLLNDPVSKRCAACRGTREFRSASIFANGQMQGSVKRPPAAEDIPSLTHPSKRQQTQSHGTVAPAESVAKHDGVLRLAAPPCLCSSNTKLQRVRKPGVNHGRLFWSCPKRQGQSCRTFLWADGRFPSCLCPPKCRKKALLRRVLKEGRSNGRYFFACANGKSRGGATRGQQANGDGCGYFSWESEHPSCWDATATPVVLPL